jgi:hypothetical protein
MKPTFLITADWHLTSRALDEYRWELFPWLRKQVKARGVGALIVAGDIADLKDNHPSALVNRLVDEVKTLAELCSIHLISGNHDYTDPDNPYWRFLVHVRGVSFYHRPHVATLSGVQVCYLPHTKHWRRDWGIKGKKSFLKGHDLIVFHQPIKGAETEAGEALEEGLPSKVFRREVVGDAFVVGGDIHVPQQVGNATYTGAPYPIRFGDAYNPRVVLWSPGEKPKSLPRPGLRKAVVTTDGDAEDWEGLTEGDMVKVRLVLPRSEYVDWQKRKREVEKAARERGLKLCGVEVKEKAVLDDNGGPDVEAALGVKNPRDRVALFREYCTSRKVSRAVTEVGVGIVRGDA